MQVSSSEGLANRTVPESCVGLREGVGEALTGVRIGWVLSRENNTPGTPRHARSGAETRDLEHPARRKHMVLLLTGLSGIAWTIVYIDSIRASASNRRPIQCRSPRSV